MLVAALVVLVAAGFVLRGRLLDEPAAVEPLAVVAPSQPVAEPVVERPSFVADAASAPQPLVQQVVPDAQPSPSFAVPDMDPLPDHVDLVIVDPHGKPVAEAEVLVCSRPAPRSPEEMREFMLSSSLHAGKGETVDKALAMDRLKKFIEAGRPAKADWNQPSARYLTDSNGACSVPIVSGNDEILAAKEGVGTSGIWQSSRSKRTPGAPLGDASGLRITYETSATLVLREPASVHGVVLDQRGEPLPLADVEIGKFLSSIGRDDETKARHPGPVVSGKDGHFRFTMDAPTYLRVKARLAGEETAELSLRANPGEDLAIELRFPGAYGVNGIVVDGEGRPVQGATIKPSGYDAPSNLECLSEAEGAFRLELVEAGSFDLMVRKPGLVQQRPASVTISEEAPEDSVRLQMVEGSTIAGRVRWSTGEPLPGVMVHARAERRDLPEEFSGFGFIVDRAGVTAADGSFEFKDIHPELDFTVSVFAGITATAQLDGVPPGSRDLELVLDREAAKGVEVRLRVLDADSGQPVQRFEVKHGSWINGVHGNEPTRTIEDAQGRFVLEGCKPGASLGFVVRAADHARRQVGPVVPTQEGADVTVSLGRAGTIVVTVVGADGAAVPGAHVLLAEAMSDTFDRFDYLQAATTDASGSASFEGRPPGRFTALARLDQRQSDLLRVDHASGSTTQARLVLSEDAVPGELEVILRDADGQPFVLAEVNITNLTGIDAEGEQASDSPFAVDPKTEADGRCLVSLAPGLYWVWPAPEANVFIPPKQAQVHSGKRCTLEFAEGR